MIHINSDRNMIGLSWNLPTRTKSQEPRRMILILDSCSVAVLDLSEMRIQIKIDKNNTDTKNQIKF